MSRAFGSRKSVFGAAAGMSVALLLAAASSPASAQNMPNRIHYVPPDYPKAAQKRGLEGWVVLEFTVDELGNVVAPRVVDAQPQGVFDAAALASASQWKYAPAQRNGQAVPQSNVQVKVKFALK